MENRLNESAMLRTCSTVGSVMLDEPAILTVSAGTSSSPNNGLMVIIFSCLFWLVLTIELRRVQLIQQKLDWWMFLKRMIEDRRWVRSLIVRTYL